MLLGSLPKQVILTKRPSDLRASNSLPLFLPEMRVWTLDTNTVFPRIHNFQFPLVRLSSVPFSSLSSWEIAPEPCF